MSDQEKPGAANQAAADNEVRESVRSTYALIASGDLSSCCGPTDGAPGIACGAPPDPAEVAKAIGYDLADLADLPPGANLGLGCGNPQAIANLKAGETVVDLGSGAGVDCFLAAKKVGATGRVIGVDMTPDMLSRARQNGGESTFDNVEFRLGEIENLPIADGTVNVIISNCVINLSPDKQRVFDEAFRILKPGGRIAVSDVTLTAQLPEEMLADPVFHAGCVSGAEPIPVIEAMMKKAGFEAIAITPVDESRELIDQWAPGVELSRYIVSAFIEGVRPA